MPEPLCSALIRLGLQFLVSDQVNVTFYFSEEWRRCQVWTLPRQSCRWCLLQTFLSVSLLIGSLLMNTSEVFCWSPQHGHILINYSLQGILVKDVLRLIHPQVVLGETTSRLRSKYVKICVTCSPLHDLVNMFWNPSGILPILEVFVLFENFVLIESQCSIWIYLLYFHHC